MPQGCDLVAAGALAVASGTSHVALVHRAQLSSGQVCVYVSIKSHNMHGCMVIGNAYCSVFLCG